MLVGMLMPLLVHAQASSGPAVWHFVNATDAAGLTSSHGYISPYPNEAQSVAGGAAAGDFDRDGLPDLYVVAGDVSRNLLFRNRGDGAFEEVGQAAGVSPTGGAGSGPLFFDFDGDGLLDLFVGGVDGGQSFLFRNLGGGTFANVTEASGLTFPLNTVSATAADYDGDGRLDLFLSHWGALEGGCHLWRNAGGGHFACADDEAGLSALVDGATDRTFAANFVDLDHDGRMDLLVSADFRQSSAWLNMGAGRFRNVTNATISDENGMGTAVGDYDGDGEIDWFVSSVFDGDGTTEGQWGKTGNRLYRGLGEGLFEDATEASGIRDGAWGWGATFADFDNDGWLDLVQVNGWPRGSPQFRGTAARLFMGGPAGHFDDRASALDFDDRVGGRGVVAFDYDGDGDVDIFIANSGGPNHLWRNDGGRAGGHFIAVRVMGDAPNQYGVGATVYLTAGGRTQTRIVRAGSNYASQDPFDVHFGLGTADRIDRLRVVWPDGREDAKDHLTPDRLIVVAPADREVAREGCSGG
jgi:hypothetical protein